MLAAEDGATLGHRRLDVAVAHARTDRVAAVLHEDLGDGARADEVVDDLGARMAAEHAAGHERGGGRPRHRLRVVVDQEDAIGVAVEGQSEVGLFLEDAGP